MSKDRKQPTNLREGLDVDAVTNAADAASSSAESLSDEERARIENAMAFINGLRPEISDSAGVGMPADVDTAKMNIDGTIDTSRSPESTETTVGRRHGITPKAIGRFEIERLLGQGGFASVYLARDPKLNRNVAIKVLKPISFFSSDASDRFDREAQAAAVLNHPNIVPVFECGTIGSDRYIVSAFSDGITLKDWADQNAGSVTPRAAAEIVSTLADAVAHAHQRGIVHRDLKPANILVETAGGANDVVGGSIPGTLRVTDFGLAKYADSVDQLETADGAIVGTPAYMSPEQAKGVQDIGHSSDIYSLGVILYELLTGQLPIIGKTHIETLLAIGKLEPKPPRRINPAVPKDLEAICLKCLGKSPDDRYASSLDLALDLRRWLGGEVVHARRVSRVERVRKWCRRNPALATAFVAMMAVSIFATFQWRSAVAERQRADRSSTMTQDLIDELVYKVTENSELPPTMRREFSERAVNLQVQLLAEDPDDRRVIKQTANAYRRFGRLLSDIGEPELAIDMIDHSLELVDRYADEPDFAEIKMAGIRYKTGILRIIGEAEKAAATIEAAKLNTNQTDYDKASNFFQLGLSKARGGNLEGAILDYEMAMSLYEDLFGSFDDLNSMQETDIARLRFHHACAEMDLELLDEAKARFELANETFELNMTRFPNHARVAILQDCARCHLQLARIAWAQSKLVEDDDALRDGLLAESRIGFDRATDLFQQLLELNPMMNGAWGQLAMVYELRNQLEVRDKKEERSAEIVALFSDLFGRTPERVREYRIIGEIVIDAHLRLAELYLEKEQFDPAVEQLNQARTLLDQMLEKFPGSAKLEAFDAKCDRLLDDHGV